jgi:hypothetical protein
MKYIADPYRQVTIGCRSMRLDLGSFLLEQSAAILQSHQPIMANSPMATPPSLLLKLLERSALDGHVGWF